MKIFAFIVGAVGVIALIIGIMLLFTFPLMWAMNYVFAPAVLTLVFGASQLTFWKTFVFGCVISMLFKGTSTPTTSK